MPPGMLSSEVSNESLISPHQQRANFQIVPIGKFVSGFLAQLIQNESIDTCLKCAIWAATQIVQKSGCTYEGNPRFCFRS